METVEDELLSEARIDAAGDKSAKRLGADHYFRWSNKLKKRIITKRKTKVTHHSETIKTVNRSSATAIGKETERITTIVNKSTESIRLTKRPRPRKSCMSKGSKPEKKPKRKSVHIKDDRIGSHSAVT